MKLFFVAANKKYLLKKINNRSQNQKLQIEFGPGGRGLRFWMSEAFPLVGLTRSGLATITGGYGEEDMEVIWYHIALFFQKYLKWNGTFLSCCSGR